MTLFSNGKTRTLWRGIHVCRNGKSCSGTSGDVWSSPMLGSDVTDAVEQLVCQRCTKTMQNLKATLSYITWFLKKALRYEKRLCSVIFWPGPGGTLLEPMQTYTKLSEVVHRLRQQDADSAKILWKISVSHFLEWTRTATYANNETLVESKSRMVRTSYFFLLTYSYCDNTHETVTLLSTKGICREIHGFSFTPSIFGSAKQASSQWTNKWSSTQCMPSKINQVSCRVPVQLFEAHQCADVKNPKTSVCKIYIYNALFR